MEALIANNPELDAASLAAAYEAMDTDVMEEQPRAYTKAERDGHALVLAYLQHHGMADWDRTQGELSDRSRTELIQKVGLVEVESESLAGPMVLVPLEVFDNLMADFVLMSNMQARAAGKGNAQELWLQRVQFRLAEDAARAAWLASHDGDGSSN